MTPEEARAYVVLMLVVQGADRDWVEAHVGEASYDEATSTLSYDLTLDEPVERLTSTFALRASLV